MGCTVVYLIYAGSFAEVGKVDKVEAKEKGQTKEFSNKGIFKLVVLVY